MYSEGRADRFADELYVRCKQERKVREHLVLMTPRDQLET